ncbi:MAG: response regulator transcription factor [Ignavibacteriae bacterium]|nr:response regulator transcription factor [Ignavibacteriota bacterium]
MKLMIVDDNPMMRDLIRRIVCRAGDVTHECSSGEEAVGAYEEFKPDFVLMDVHMNGMNGFAATRKIVAKNPGAKVIIITSQNVPVYREESVRAGAIGFVEKEHIIEARRIIHS